jgi:MFS family permease
MAFGFMNAAWAVGAVIGPAVGGAIASSTGDWSPFLIAGAACALALAAVLRFGRLGAAGASSRPLQSTGPGCA